MSEAPKTEPTDIWRCATCASWRFEWAVAKTTCGTCYNRDLQFGLVEGGDILAYGEGEDAEGIMVKGDFGCRFWVQRA